MESPTKKSNHNPRESANTLSVLMWWWTLDLFKKGYKKVFDVDDLLNPLKTDRSTYLGDRLETRWNIELEKSKKRNQKPHLLKTIFRTFLWEYFWLGVIQILNEFVLRLGVPLLLGQLLQYFRKDGKGNVSYTDALLYAGGISLASALNAITINQAIFDAFHIGGRIRVAVCSLVYRKALKLSVTSLGETAPGKIVNLIANDVNRFDLVSIMIHHMWSAPLSALIIAYFLYKEAGYAGLIGIAAVFVVVPTQAYTGKLSSIYRYRTAIKTDERIRLMDEIVSGVQVIKMYAWEKPFCFLIQQARKLELKEVRKSSYIRGVYMTFNLFTTRLALFCTLLTMLMTDQQLTVDKVFVFSSFFNILAQTMSGMFVRGFAELAECMVAVRRLQQFLYYDEFVDRNSLEYIKPLASNGSLNLDPNVNALKSSKEDLPFIDEDDHTTEKYKNSSTNPPKDVNSYVAVKNENSSEPVTWAVKINNLTAKWEPHQSENTLEYLNFDLEKGKLYMVVGMVGSGKSSFLSAILGEIPPMVGSVHVQGTLSYASQEAWVFGATVRQNILFGEPYDRQRYQKVVKVCSLQRDFQQFPNGDQSIVGERGSSLSGGQKARINLARCIYRQADVYLLDDPLSAVDAHVSKHLFNECIKRYLAGKTTVLATHQLQYIKEVDGIILFDQGKAIFFNNYQDLLKLYPEYEFLIAMDGEKETEDTPKERDLRRRFSQSSQRSKTFDDTEIEEEKEEAKSPSDDNIEGTSLGVVSGSLFLKYVQSGANLGVAFIVFALYILAQFAASLNDYFIQILVNAEETRYNNGLERLRYNETNGTIPYIEDPPSTKTLINIYTIIVCSIFIVAITRSIAFYTLCIRCSQRLHDLAFGTMIKTDMRFYDTNPSGRILNRFSKDMGAIDELLPKSTLDAGQIILTMVGSLVVACTVNAMFLIPIVFLGCLFYWIRKVYLKTSTNIKRLEGMTKSPVFTQMNTTLNGLATIRAYKAQDMSRREFDRCQDLHTSSWYMFIATSTAFGFSLDIFCFIFTTLVTFSFLLLPHDVISGAEVGLAISQVMAMTGMVQWGMRQGAEVTNQLLSVERVLEYTTLAPEPNLRMTSIVKKKKDKKAKVETAKDAPKNWPNKGQIVFNNVYMKYAETEDYVLKRLNITVQSGEKVGIVGRTGAGKSSLISALFRLAKIEGVIEIDGIDTGTIYLEDLRKNISIIPQDPVLFSGNIRRNLDPFNEFSDDLLWEALDEVKLKEAVVAAGNGLDSRVSDRGSNYSVGQRQLVCLARAILRNNRILMLDEATANVDPQTDALIQRTIRTKFASCTVLTVAHRLNTIMDSDKVLVMDKGHMAEYDHPHVLLQLEGSQFQSLVKETGRAMYDQLVKVAEQSYNNKKR